MSAFTLRQLEIFTLVVEHGSFRRCAEHLGVSQVSISEHVRELEARLGVRLFDRHAGGPATLTPEGRRAHQRIAAILADIDDLRLDVGGGKVNASRILAVAMHSFLMRYLAAPLAEYRSRHPQTQVSADLDSASGSALLERIRLRELDLAYFFSFDGHEAPESQLIRIEPLALFVGQSHPLASKPVVTAADIRATPAIHLTSRNPLRCLIDQALEQAGAGGSPGGIDTDDYGLILTSVCRNHGFACMFESAKSEGPQSTGMVSVPFEHPLPALQVRALTRHSVRHDPEAKELIEQLTQALSAG